MKNGRNYFSLIIAIAQLCGITKMLKIGLFYTVHDRTAPAKD